MIDLDLSPDLLILLRAMLFLGPWILTLWLGCRHHSNQRLLIAGLFSFLYNIGLLLPAHVLAVESGLWHYGGSTLMLLGMPSDIWFAGSLLFGPAIFFAFPRLSPLVFTIGFIMVQALTFHSLAPFVTAGEKWFVGVIAIFAIVHIPALYLARWTAQDICLPQRAALLAFGYGFLAFFVLPTLIMQAMGGKWQLDQYSPLAIMIALIAFAPWMVLGLTAVQMFVIHGEGTPIPLDKTRYLVRSGIYAHITNPMQLCSAISWVILGLFLQNLFIALAAVMAFIFVQGLVRWHHRHDLAVRFPEGWPEYKQHVPDWIPRWKPWIKHVSTLTYNPYSPLQRHYIIWLQRFDLVGLEITENNNGSMSYIDGNRGLPFKGASAAACALFHINLLTTWIGSLWLLMILPWQWIQQTGGKDTRDEYARPPS
jgi:protein-S-isoprenylcysteine O-methyltransferase Ste14